MKILIFGVCSAQPRRGSEPGAGWLWSVAASANHDTTVLTRASRARAIRPEDVPERMTVRGIDLPGPLL